VNVARVRWQSSRRFRRLRARWQSFRLPEGAKWNSPQSPLLTPEQGREAISEACRIVDAVPQGEPRRSRWSQTVGGQIRGRDGTASWVKIACISSELADWLRAGELTAPSVAGLPRPEILREFEWTDGSVRWHALQLSLAPSPVILGQPWIADPIHSIEDRWIAELKRAIEATNKVPLARWAVHPGRIARVIAQRFGKRAPYAIDEWQTAHGDLNWSNVTAPDLMLLDWEFWGAAPRGYDAATLLAHSFIDPVLFRRVETVFADDLNTRSGIVSRLYQFASQLDKVETGLRDPREHRIAEAEVRRLLRL
jgi:hypothetical protein